MYTFQGATNKQLGPSCGATARVILMQAATIIILMITITTVFMAIYITRNYVLGFYVNNIAPIFDAFQRLCNPLAPILLSASVRQMTRQLWRSDSSASTHKRANVKSKTTGQFRTFRSDFPCRFTAHSHYTKSNQ